MFKRFFENIDYEKLDEKEFIKEGEQTKSNERIRKIAKNIYGDNNSVNSIIGIIYWIKEYFGHSKKDREKLKFNRKAIEILENGYTGCSDFAILFETTAREKQIPTIHVQTVKKIYVQKLQEGKETVTEGHHFCECYIKGKWILVDPINEKILIDYDKNDFNIGKYYVFSKSTDIFETGIKGIKENNHKIEELFLDFDIKKFHPANDIGKNKDIEDVER